MGFLSWLANLKGKDLIRNLTWASKKKSQYLGISNRGEVEPLTKEFPAGKFFSGKKCVFANWGDGQEDVNDQPFAQDGRFYSEWQYALFVRSERRPVGRLRSSWPPLWGGQVWAGFQPAGLSSNLLTGPFFLLNSSRGFH